MTLRGEDLALQGEARAKREAEAWEAREEGWKIEADLIALMGRAMEANQATQHETVAEIRRDKHGEAEQEAAEEPAPVRGSTPLNRQGLIRSLQQQNSRAADQAAEKRRRRG